MSDALHAEADAKVAEIAGKTGMPPAVVRGVLGDTLAMKANRKSLHDIAADWGIAFGQLLAAKNMGRIVLDDIRAMAVSKRLAIADTCVNEAIRRLNNPEDMAAIKTRELVLMGKQMDDAALNLSNGNTGGGVTINIGDLRALRERQAERAARPSLEDRLREKGIVIEAEIAGPVR